MLWISVQVVIERRIATIEVLLTTALVISEKTISGELILVKIDLRGNWQLAPSRLNRNVFAFAFKLRLGHCERLSFFHSHFMSKD